MKKWALLAASSLLMVNVHANDKLCGYSDYFHLSDDTNPNVAIVSGSSDAELYLELISKPSFLIKGGDQCQSGFAHITISSDETHTCALDIKDGPYILHPTIAASCTGLTYFGTEHDGIGSYSYTIHIK